MKIDGRCYCGFIAYEAEVDPEKVRICHGTDCQILAGSAFRTVVPVGKNGFKLLS
ncbi:GFA family protein [Hypericibacter sp.]|uniref:GFA family protein n=1 Tax=Hypericibacter sp. TaxID=2705401 RepID=UPI003D6CB732